MIGGDADAGTERQGAIGHADDVGEADFLRRPAERIASRPAAMAPHDAALFQFQQNLFEKFYRNISPFRQILDLMNRLVLILGDEQQGSERIFRSPGNPHSDLVNPKTPEVSRVFRKNAGRNAR